MSYSRNEGGYDNRDQGGIPQAILKYLGNSSPWATAAPADGNNMSNLLGSHATQEDSTQNFHKFPNPTPSSTFVNTGSRTMSNVATSLVDQALQNKPGRGMLFGRNHFDGQGSAPMGGPSFNDLELHIGDRY